VHWLVCYKYLYIVSESRLLTAPSEFCFAAHRDGHLVMFVELQQTLWFSEHMRVTSNPYIISTRSVDCLVFSQQTGCSNLSDISVTLNTLSAHLPLANQRFPFFHYASRLPPFWTVSTWHRAEILAATLYLHTVRLLSRNYANAEQGILLVSAASVTGGTGGATGTICWNTDKRCSLPTQCGYVFGTSVTSP
jgi:hypothetical protein